MENKTCVVCITEKIIDNFHNKYRECIQCSIQRSLKRYYESKDKMSHYQKHIMKKIEIDYCKDKILDTEII